MQRKSVEAAQREFRRACEKLAEMERVESDADRLAHLWSEFLTSANRVFNKLAHGPKQGPSAAWFGRMMGERKADKLLRYVHHARDADTHGVEKITDDPNLVQVTIKPLSEFQGKPVDGKIVPSGTLHQDGRYEFHEMMVEKTSVVLHLVPVTNRGVVFDPPQTGGKYLGQELAEATPVNVARLMVEYLGGIVGQADAYATSPRKEISDKPRPPGG